MTSHLLTRNSRRVAILLACSATIVALGVAGEVGDVNACAYRS